MDVRCDRCNSEYEFEDARVPEAGLSVKCSTCGHVFRVFRPSGGPSLPDGSGGEWMIRQTTGNVFTFKELTTLQRWIVERKVQRDDEISKSGRQWKRLGNIAELATFFQVVDSQAVPAPQPMPAQATPAGWGAQQVPVPPSMPGGGPQSGAAWEANPQPPTWNQQSDNWQMQSTQPGVGGQNVDIDLSSFPSSAMDDDDDFEFRRGGSGKWILLVLVILALGGAGLTYHLRPELLAGLIGPKINERAVLHLENGYAALRRDSTKGIDEAIESFSKAISIDGEYADARAGLAEAELARAEYLDEEADALARTMSGKAEEEQKKLKVKVEALKREASQRSERAFNAAKEAMRLAPAALAPNRAMADYYRAKKASEQMKPLIERAKAAGPEDPGVAYVLGSSVAGDKTAAELAMRYFDEALEGAPDMNRARYKLARVFLAQQARQKALLQLNTILRAEPSHERAKALKLELEPPEPVAAPAPESEPEKKEMSYEQVLAKAERLRQADRASQALALYERAAEMEPSDAEGYIGLGFCYVDLDEPGVAVSNFKQALRYAPRMSDAHIGIAEAYRMMGDRPNAITHYRRYLEIMPAGDEAPVARRMIEMLAE